MTVVDELMNALIRQKIRIVYTRKNTIILYDEGRQREAIALAKDLRRKAQEYRVIKKSKEKLLEEYRRIRKRILCRKSDLHEEKWRNYHDQSCNRRS